ncbi:MAG: class I SAM-dependent methyltransferase [Candidatus Firestonebacteria bacterium]
MTVLTRNKDAFGQALFASYISGQNSFIVERDDGLFSEGGPLKVYFDNFSRWPLREKAAMMNVKGRVLDIGCGAGRHALYLQKKGHKVVAIDNSPLAIKVCRLRGVTHAKVMSIKDISRLKADFDTVLMMCNNFGLFGTIKKARKLLNTLKKITAKDSRIITESYDYMHPYYREYKKYNKKKGRSPGALRVRIRYGKTVTSWFDYVRVTAVELKQLVKGTGWIIERIIDSKSSSYIAVLKREA